MAAVKPAASPRPFGAADTAFGLDVLGAWCRADPGSNLVFSPSTLASALGMAYLGARGTTAAAIARVLHLPLAGGVPPAAQQINAAVSAQTRGHITRLVTPDSLADTGWVLTAALYLDARWATPFSPGRTASGTFTAATGRRVTARYLNGSGFSLATAGGWTAVSLPWIVDRGFVPGAEVVRLRRSRHSARPPGRGRLNCVLGRDMDSSII